MISQGEFFNLDPILDCLVYCRFKRVGPYPQVEELRIFNMYTKNEVFCILGGLSELLIFKHLAKKYVIRNNPQEEIVLNSLINEIYSFVIGTIFDFDYLPPPNNKSLQEYIQQTIRQITALKQEQRSLLIELKTMH